MKTFITKLRLIFDSIVSSLIRNIGGGLGEKLRYFYYKGKLKAVGKNLRIGVGVNIIGCENIIIGSNVWIDDYCILIAGMPDNWGSREVTSFKNKNFKGCDGDLIIGSQIHIAPFCVLNAFGGGISIGDFSALSSAVKVYSTTNHYRSMKHKNLVTYSHPMISDSDKIVSIVTRPVCIGINSFITLNAMIVCGSVGSNSYVAPGSLVTMPFADNSVISGNPAIVSGVRFE